MKKITLFLVAFILFLNSFIIAGEGMWLPIFLKQLNEAEMQSQGMKVSAEDIYSVNKSSMKDAVVLFDNKCTGEIISDQGLLLTNHHCGITRVQALSTVEKNILKNGYWSFKMDEELPCKGLTVTFIIRMEDVTQPITSELSANMTEKEREAKIKEISVELIKKAVEGTHYSGSVRPFYNGNQFYLFVMETFKDVRLVGTPPNSIGKFGGDTDNWMWPRHTGDFSVFRVYAGADNRPADYSPANVPFKPRYFFPISLKGVQPGDFTMVYGFPGNTTQYLPAAAIKNIIEVTNPSRIKIRDARLEIIDEAIRTNDKLRIQYTDKQVSIANGWKKWQGELKGLERLETMQMKQKEEAAFKKWYTENNKSEYATLLPDFNIVHSSLAPLIKVQDYINEAAYGVELLKYARGLNKLAKLSTSEVVDEDSVKIEVTRLLSSSSGFYRNFDVATDKKLFASMMHLYFADIDLTMRPNELKDIFSKYKGNFSKYADELYSKSAFSDSTKLKSFLTSYTSKKSKQLLNDPAYKLAQSFWDIYTTHLEKEITKLNASVSLLNRKYMAAQMDMQKDRKFYPDANSTLRVAYGQVSEYEPKDAVTYSYFTTIKGIFEKENPAIEEFEVSEKLKTLNAAGDFGPYGVNGTLPVAFVASNHTTGGNSGSPVLNANGELIGTNFDRVWEGTMSDIDFDPDQCRNISLDIRFTLFIIDKFAGCKRLIDEMKIIK
ncbi:MAG: S46 family peptidase [Bacteroidetes bacterium]|nr:S46 family peptidase [Bacteroidota bacterium]